MAAKVAVIGCGHWGRNLVRNMHELGALSAVSDANETTAADMGARHGVPALSYDDTLADAAVDGVVLASPAHLHARMALDAFAAGKHVYVEKPIALDVADAEAMIAAAGVAGRTLMVGHLLQYHPAFVRLKEMVAAGELGPIRYLYSNRLNLGKLRTEEDAFWSLAPHDVSMVLALAGEAPAHVQGIGAAFLQPLADFFTVHLGFPSGAKGHVTVSWLNPFKEQKLVVVGERAMAVFDDLQPWESKLVLYRHRAEIANGVPVLERADAEPVALAASEPLKDECRHFLDCIETGATPRTDGREALGVLRVLMAGSGAA